MLKGRELWYDKGVSIIVDLTSAYIKKLTVLKLNNISKTEKHLQTCFDVQQLSLSFTLCVHKFDNFSPTER